MTSDRAFTWSIVIPVKVLARAKSRIAGISATRRAALALAMAADTVAAAVACPAVRAVLVVTDDPQVRAVVVPLGAEIVADRPGTGLNSALRRGAAEAAARWPGNGRAALAGDLPALDPDGLATALTAASGRAHSFVADAAGSGTTLYAVAPGAEFRPSFGPGSADRHRLEGAVELAIAAGSGLRQDVDTMADLWRAARLGLGPRSAVIAAGLAVA